jgi:hypothetical protein
MTTQPIPPLIDFFKHIKDPRIERNKAYPLLEVIVIWEGIASGRWPGCLGSVAAPSTDGRGTGCLNGGGGGMRSL